MGDWERVWWIFVGDGWFPWSDAWSHNPQTSVPPYFQGSFPASRDQKGHVYHQIWLVLQGPSACGPRFAAGTFRGDDKRLWDLKKSDTVFEALSEWIYEPSLDHLPVPGELSMVASFNSITGRHEGVPSSWCWIHWVISWSAVFVGSGLDTLNVLGMHLGSTYSVVSDTNKSHRRSASQWLSMRR